MDEASAVSSRLRAQGIAVTDAWLAMCISAGRAAGVSDALGWVFAQFLAADLRTIGDAAALPPSLQPPQRPNPFDAAPAVLRGRFVLQIDELSDVSAPHDDRWAASSSSAAHRMLKLRMSCGPELVLCGVEAVRLPSLGPETRPGAKIALRDVPVRRGLLQLSPACALVLGGSVGALCDAAAAHTRAVQRRKRPALARPDDVPDRRPLQPQQQQQQIQPNAPIVVVAASRVVQQSAPKPPVVVAAAVAAAAVAAAPPSSPPCSTLPLGLAIERAARGELRRAVCKAAVVGAKGETFSWKEGRFALSVYIDDGQTQIIADFSSQLLEQLIGASALDYAELDLETRDQLDSSMEAKLAMLEGMMTIDFEGGGQTAVVSAVEPPQPRDCWAALQRVTKLLQQRS